MGLQANVSGRWLAALVLLIPALLGFQIVAFELFGALLMLGAAFAAAVSTGYARKDAFGVAVGCGVLVLVGGALETGHPAAAAIAYACAAAVAIRPSGRLAIGARVAGLFALFLLAGHLRTLGEVHAWGRVHGWWALLFIPPVVAGVDALADRLGQTPAPTVSSRSKPMTESRSPASTGLMLVSTAGLVVVLLPWILGFGNGYGSLRLGVVGLALAAAAVGGARAVQSARTDPVRSVGTIVLSIVPIVILGSILLALFAFAFGKGWG
jgi:hypothetical protein